ncbi:hypothetical protein [Tenacibaculum amylolyticum]|uniref:hypothetical protein n=1 Tax=Tenacibaculum amylolyticum TaxID=104269 RepID=UPI003893FDDB
MNIRLKFSYLFPFLVFLNSCSYSKKQKERDPKSVKSLTEKQIDTIKPINSDINQDCIFDQSTQNDGFLKDINELKNYTWDSIKKTATIKISDQEILKIHRGGCDHFSLNAEFTVPKSITFDHHKEYIFSRILWVSELLYKSSFKAIKDALKDNKISITQESSHFTFISLTHEELYESFFVTFKSDNTEYNTFSISYYIN